MYEQYKALPILETLELNKRNICRVPMLPGKPWILSFTFSGLQNAWNLLKNWKTWNFNSKPGKNLYFKFCFSRFTFQDVIFKKNIWITSVISALSTQTRIQSQIGLGFHCIYLEITWKMHGILCHQRSGNLDMLIATIKLW